MNEKVYNKRRKYKVLHYTFYSAKKYVRLNFHDFIIIKLCYSTVGALTEEWSSNSDLLVFPRSFGAVFSISSDCCISDVLRVIIFSNKSLRTIETSRSLFPSCSCA